MVEARATVRAAASGRIFPTLCQIAMMLVFLLFAGQKSPAEAALLVKRAFSPAKQTSLPGPSRFALSFRLPFSKLETLLNQFTFQVDRAGVKLGLFRYEATMLFTHLSIAASDDARYPVKLSGPFQLAGHISGSNVVGRGTMELNIGSNVDADWCTMLQISGPTLRWDQASPLLRWAINLKVMDQVVREEIERLRDCDKLKEYIGKAWMRVGLPILAADPRTGNTLAVNVAPQAISVSNVAVDRDGVVLGVTITASTALASHADKPTRMRLPPPALQERPNDGDGEINALFSGNLDLNFP
jgi:hypothetical protein